ncbi:MAG: hypothetical protein WBB37_09160 [bacterium]
MKDYLLCLTAGIWFGLKPLPFGTLLLSVATSYMLGTLSEIAQSALKTMKVIEANKKSNLYSIEGWKNEDE